MQLLSAREVNLKDVVNAVSPELDELRALPLQVRASCCCFVSAQFRFRSRWRPSADISNTWIGRGIVTKVEHWLMCGVVGSQVKQVEQLRVDESLELPTDLAYDSLGAISLEERQLLERAQPATLGAASR